MTAHRTSRRRVGAAAFLTAAAVLVVAASAGGASAQSCGGGAASTTRPVKLRVFSPTSGDLAGRDGAGFTIDLAFTARDRAANGWLSGDAGYRPFFKSPDAPSFTAGTNRGAPGLVVLLSTTPATPGTALQGPNTNLAGLFQINGVGMVRGGRTRILNTWHVGRPTFGTGAATLTAYVVKGAAPAVVPDAGLEKISNTVTVRFSIPGPIDGSSTPPASGAGTRRLR